MNRLNKLNTPFGYIYVKLNEDIIDFKCSIKNYNYNSKIVQLILIDIDTIDLKVGDIVSCGFNDKTLEFNDGDERSVLLTCENDEMMLGLCGFEPQYHEGEEEWYSYYMEHYDDYGFLYSIKREPKKYLDDFYKSKVITLAICCMKKEDFKNIDDDIFMVLTAHIG